MIALKAEDVKSFTSRLFIKEDFDSFWVRELNIVTYNSFTMDGHIRSGYYTEEEREEQRIGEFSSWRQLRPFCFSLIKGKKLPESFKIVLQLPAGQTERFASKSGTGISGDQIQGLYLNIRYEEGELYCITGTALKFFTLDKALEVQWDESVREFFRSRQIPCTQEGVN